LPDQKTARTVLVVDDYDDSRHLLAIRLRREGYRVVEAASGLEALAAAREARPDVVLMDLSMPTMDGLSATCRLRELPGMRGVPVVAFTAHSRETHAVAAFAAGCDAYLAKPFSPDELLGLVDRLSSGWRDGAAGSNRRGHISSEGMTDDELLDAIEGLMQRGR
jgi:two-component system, cell cycle response regulator DivK